MHVAEFTLRAKPGAADAVNSEPGFAAFNDTIAPLIASPSERVGLKLLHSYVK